MVRLFLVGSAMIKTGNLGVPRKVTSRAKPIYAAMGAAVGLIKSLLTLNKIDQITETRSDSKRETRRQGGQYSEWLFLWNGGLCHVAAEFILHIFKSVGAGGSYSCFNYASFHHVFGPWIEKAPMAALTGLMIMVAVGIF